MRIASPSSFNMQPKSVMLFTMRRFVVSVLLLVSGSCHFSAGQAHSEWSVQSKPLADVVAEVSDSVVFIRTEEGTGSGFYLNPSGQIVTARHVVTKQDGSTAKNIVIVLSAPANVIDKVSFDHAESTITAHVVLEDSQHDLALLTPITNPFAVASDAVLVNGKPLYKKGRPVALCNRGLPLRSGDPVFTIGHPLNDVREVTTRGIVSSSGALQFDDTGVPNLTYLVDMVINPGNSGGPVFTSTGCVIGVADAVTLSKVTGITAGQKPLPEVRLSITDPDGKPIMKDGSPVTTVLEYSSGLGLLISQEYIFKMLDNAGYKHDTN